MEVSKRDWKLYREKVPGWQERYMEKLVQQYMDYLGSDKPASTKFWKMEKRIKQDKKNPGVLIEMSKSDMLYDLIRMINYGVITVNDLTEFSDDLKESIRLLLERME